MLSHFSHVWLFVTQGTVACQDPLSVGFSRQEYWSGLPCPSAGDLPDPGIEPASLMSPAVAGMFSTTCATWEAPRPCWGLPFEDLIVGDLKDLVPGCLRHKTGSLVQAVGRKPQFLSTWSSPPGCLSILTTWLLTFLRVSVPRDKAKIMLQCVVTQSQKPNTSFPLYSIHYMWPTMFSPCSSVLKKAMAPHSSTLAWKIQWTEEPDRLQSMGLLRVRHDWATSLSLFTFMHWRRKWQPTPVFLPGESHGQGSLVGCRLWGHTELDTTEAI